MVTYNFWQKKYLSSEVFVWGPLFLLMRKKEGDMT